MKTSTTQNDETTGKKNKYQGKKKHQKIVMKTRKKGMQGRQQDKMKIQFWKRRNAKKRMQ